MATLDKDTSLHQLLSDHPFLLDFLPEFNPKFALLKNPALRATAGRFAILGRVAEMGGIPLEELVGAIQDEIRRVEGGKTAQLKSIILELHHGLDPEEAKARFNEVVRDVSAREIGAMEQELIRGGLPVEEIQRLCDLHVAVVRSALEEGETPEVTPGHPAHTYQAANAVITTVANRLGELCAELSAGTGTEPDWAPAFEAVLDEISGIHNHYLRKENELFPVLERHGVTGPSQVMWGVHDEIRQQLKAARAALGLSSDEAVLAGATLARSVIEMVYKENKILLPLALETLTDEEWAEVRRGEDELGYAFVEPAGEFPAAALPGADLPGVDLPGVDLPAPDLPAAPPPRRPTGPSLGLPVVSAAPMAPLPGPQEGYLDLGTGRLSLEQVDMILRHLPLDLSFVDADGFVRYYSETQERLFPRTPGAIGRHVTNCHPPKSVHMVEEILRAFAEGKREVAEFWIEMGGKFIHIRYFAVRNEAKEYLGCLEVTQDVTEIRALEGQRRLLEWS